VTFLGLWLTGYVSPRRLVDGLAHAPAPHYGIYAQLLRGLFDSLLIYLPVALLGRVPPTPSYLPFIPTERYYAGLVVLGPLVLLADLLLSAAFLHIALRLLGRASSYDILVNLIGMAALVVGAVLIPWDWVWYFMGRVNQYFLGISHLVMSLWATVIIVTGMNRLLDVPVRTAIPLSLLAMVVSLPLRIVFMRSPF